MRSPFLRPAAHRVASKEASAPDANLAVSTTASSTVTVPVPGAPASGRAAVNVAASADTPAISSPVR
jgi:hypothetical protein